MTVPLLICVRRAERFDCVVYAARALVSNPRSSAIWTLCDLWTKVNDSWSLSAKFQSLHEIGHSNKEAKF
jgi:hypothetical protein